MNVGDRIKQLRTEKNLTQPQLAEVIGIEQSYLSKLENDKSIPSADIFQALLKGLAVDVGTFLHGIDEVIIGGQLKRIPEVALYLNAQSALRVHNIKKWLFSSALGCTFGLTLVVAGYKSLLFPSVIYEYISGGVVKASEPDDLFANLGLYGQSIGCGYDFQSTLKPECEALGAQYRLRLKVEPLLLSEYQGHSLTRDESDGGRRVFYFKQERVVTLNANRWLMLVGTLLAFGGLFGFIVEYRLRKI